MAAETILKPGSIRQQAIEVLRRLSLPNDALLLIYFAVFARQYLWWCTDKNAVAWVAAAVTAMIVTSLYVASKETTRNREDDGPTLHFWLIAVMPLVFVYSMRVVFPDVSFDVLNYRLLHAERALHGFLYLPGEFFPTPAPYNPAPDMVTGLFRHALGYRLGTIANLLAMIWVARVTDKLLRPYLRNAWLRSFGVLLAVMTEHMLLEINNYMADLLALPLLLEATHLALRHAELKNQRRNLVCVALLLGMSVAFKLTNAAVALPVILLCTYQALFARRENYRNQTTKAVRDLASNTLLSAAAFILPLLPFSVYLYRETGSIVFPVFNGIFKSVYWPANNIWDPRWGPVGLWEKLWWPIFITFKPERLSELAVYSGRISFGFAAALVGCLFVRCDARLRELCLLVVATSLLWSASTGYIRYAFYVEVMSAVVVLTLAVKLANQSTRLARRPALAMACLIWLGLLFQVWFACRYVSRLEWAGRPTIFTNPAAYRNEARYLFRDRSLRDFLSSEALARFDQVEVWIVSSIKTSGLAVMLKRDAPMIGVRNDEFFRTKEGRDRFELSLERADGKRMFSLAFREDFQTAKAELYNRGLTDVSVDPIDIPFYSPNVRIPIFLIKVARTNQYISERTPHAFPDSAYRAVISSQQQPGIMKPGAKVRLRLRVRNASTGVWPSRVPQGWMHIVTVGDRWLSANGVGVVDELDSRTALPHDLKPGDEAELVLTVTAPKTEGEYVLEIDMVHEGVTWFYQRGSPTLRWPVRVEK